MIIDPQCCLCVGGMESSLHPFTHCTYSVSILSSLCKMMHFLPDTSSWLAILNSATATVNVVHRHIIWLGLAVIAYFIWKERNAKLHDSSSSHPAQLLDFIILDIKSKLSSSSWFCKHACNNFFFSSCLTS